MLTGRGVIWRYKCHLWVTAAPVQLICPCVVGRKDLMTKFYPAAVGDTHRGQTKSSSGSGAGIILVVQAAATDPGVRWTGRGVIWRYKCHLWVTAAPVQLICPCVVGRKDLMTKFYPAAVGDTSRTRVRQSLRREDGAGIIGGASRRH